MLSLVSFSTHASSGVQLPSLDAKCTGTSRYVHSSSYGARVSTWGHVSRGGWRGAVLGPDGNKIYGIPTNATSVLEIDPIQRKLSTFGDLGEAPSPLASKPATPYCFGPSLSLRIVC